MDSLISMTHFYHDLGEKTPRSWGEFWSLKILRRSRENSFQLFKTVLTIQNCTELHTGDSYSFLDVCSASIKKKKKKKEKRRNIALSNSLVAWTVFKVALCR